MPVTTGVSLAWLVARAETMRLAPLAVVSLVSRLPPGLLPAVPFRVPPASTAMAVSDTAFGSGRPEPSTVMVRVAVDVSPALSRMV